MALLNKSVPTEEEQTLARESSQRLARAVPGHSSTVRISVLHDTGNDETIFVPASAFQLFVELLSQMAQGNIVTLFPIHAELTTQESADLINVSRPFLIKQMKDGELKYRTVGKHRRVKFQDLMDYKERMDALRSKALDDLVAQAQELDMGYE